MAKTLPPSIPAQSTPHADALQALSDHFGAERWAKLIQRGERAGLNAEGLAELAQRMVTTRRDHHPLNERAALLAAACGFLCVLGFAPTAADEAVYQSALAATAV